MSSRLPQTYRRETKIIHFKCIFVRAWNVVSLYVDRLVYQQEIVFIKEKISFEKIKTNRAYLLYTNNFFLNSGFIFRFWLWPVKLVYNFSFLFLYKVTVVFLRKVVWMCVCVCRDTCVIGSNVLLFSIVSYIHIYSIFYILIDISNARLIYFEHSVSPFFILIFTIIHSQNIRGWKKSYVTLFPQSLITWVCRLL